MNQAVCLGAYSMANGSRVFEKHQKHERQEFRLFFDQCPIIREVFQWPAIDNLG